MGVHVGPAVLSAMVWRNSVGIEAGAAETIDNCTHDDGELHVTCLSVMLVGRDWVREKSSTPLTAGPLDVLYTKGWIIGQ